MLFSGSRVRYAITKGNEQGLFRLDGQTGRVDLVAPLDFEIQNQVSETRLLNMTKASVWTALAALF